MMNNQDEHSLKMKELSKQIRELGSDIKRLEKINEERTTIGALNEILNNIRDDLHNTRINHAKLIRERQSICFHNELEYCPIMGNEYTCRDCGLMFSVDIDKPYQFMPLYDECDKETQKHYLEIIVDTALEGLF